MTAAALSLHTIARCLGGRVRGDKVTAPGPEATSKQGWKRKRHSLTVWINGNGDIGVNSWRGEDAIRTKDWVRARCGLPAWTPRRRRPARPKQPLPPLPERNQFLSESLRIARHRKTITAAQFALIINDLKNACPETGLRVRAMRYAHEFKIGPADVESALATKWRAYTASERATIWNVTYEEYRALDLRRSGCAELTPEERRKLTRERYNAKRRAQRAAHRDAKRDSESTSARPEAAPSQSVPVVTVREVPSSKEVVGKTERSNDHHQPNQYPSSDSPQTLTELEGRGPHCRSARARIVEFRGGLWRYAMVNGRPMLLERVRAEVEMSLRDRPFNWQRRPSGADMTDPFYRSLTWRQLRGAALRRDRWRCVVCGQRAVVVDHIASRRNGGPDALSNLRSLCPACDNRVKEDQHGNRRSHGILAGCDASGVPSDPNHPWHTPTGSNMRDLRGLDRPGAKARS